MNAKLVIYLLRAFGVIGKVGVALWAVFMVIYYLLVVRLQEQVYALVNLQHPEIPFLILETAALIIVYWLSTKATSLAASRQKDLETRFLGYLELYEDVDADVLANRLELSLHDVENMIAQFKAEGKLSNVAIDTETGRIMFGTAAKEFAKVRAERKAAPPQKAPVKPRPETLVVTRKRRPARPREAAPKQVTRLSVADVDDKLYGYLVRYKKRFTYARASKSLNIPVESLKESMERLKRDGRVVSRKGRAPSPAV